MKNTSLRKRLALVISLCMAMLCMSSLAFADEGAGDGLMPVEPGTPSVVDGETPSSPETPVPETPADDSASSGETLLPETKQDDTNKDTPAPPQTPATPPASGSSATAPQPDADITEDEKTEVPEPVFFDVTFAVGDSKSTVTVEQGKPVERPMVTPAQEGFVFVHWYDTTAGEAFAYDFAKPVSGPLTIAAWFVPQDELETYMDPANLLAIPGAEGETDLKDTLGGSILGTIDNDLGILIAVVELDEEDAEAGEGEDDLFVETESSEDGLTDEDGVVYETFEDEEIPLAGPASVTITSNAGAQMYYGDTITLTAGVAGVDPASCQFIWRYNNGGGWTDAASGPDSTYSYELTEQNQNWIWEVEAIVGA